MVGLLRVLRGITHAPGPLDAASISYSISSASLDGMSSPLPTEAIQWERQETRAKLYQSLFAALAEHGDLPPEEAALAEENAAIPLPNGYRLCRGQLYSPSIYSNHDDTAEPIGQDDIIEEPITHEPIRASESVHAPEPAYAKHVTFKDYSHLVENLRGLPMDQASSSISIKDASIEAVSIGESSINAISTKGAVSIQGSASPVHSSTTIPRRGLFRFIREKSVYAFNAVKAAIHHRRDKPFDECDSHSTAKMSFESKASQATAWSGETKVSSVSDYHWSSQYVSRPIQSATPSESPSNPRTSCSSTSIYEASHYDPPAVSCLPEYDLPEFPASDLSLQGRQMTAFISYNDLARKFGFYALCPPQHDPINYQMFIRLRPSTRELILRKVRSLGSRIRPRSPNRRVQKLRRMRTFANLSLKHHKMDSLKGKDLATIGRLCGYGSLELPGDFAPAVLELPTPIVSLVSYLVTHGPNARNIFVEPGDLVVASRIYDHFATQILSPQADITGQMAIRKSLDFSTEVFGVHSDDEDFLRGRFHVLSVAWAFKYILASIPGGILGAPRLYSTLVDIAHQTFPDEPTFSGCGLNAAMPEISRTKTRAISLAILALTNDLQLDFLCAIFGLCAYLDRETQKMLNFYRSKNVPHVNRACLLDRKRILLTFTPLLCEETKDLNDDDYGCEAFYVMNMMLDYWVVVSRELYDPAL